MRLEGSLKDVGMVELLREVAARGRTGILTFQNEADIIALTFLSGGIVAADALHEPREEGLGQVLVAQQLLSAEQFSGLLSEAKTAGQRVSGLLLERGYVGRPQILHAVRLQVYRLLLQLLQWRDGEYNLFLGDEISYEDGIASLSIEELLVRSSGDLADRGPLTGTVPDLSRTFERTIAAREIRIIGRDGDARDSQTEVWLTPNESKLLEQVDNKLSGSALILACRLNEYQVRFGLYQLRQLGLVAPARATGVFPPPAGEKLPAPPASAGSPPRPAPPLLSGTGLTGGQPALVHSQPPLMKSQPALIKQADALADLLREDPKALPGVRPMLADTGAFGGIKPPEPAPARERPAAPRPATRKISPETASALPKWFARAATFGLLLVFALSLLLRSERNQLVLPYPWQDPQRAEFEASQRATVWRKIDGAVRTYHLLYGRFPEQLGILVNLEFLAQRDTSDSLGRPFEYSASARAYSLQPLEAGVPVPGLDRTFELAEDFLLNPQTTAEVEGARPLVLLD